MNYYRNINRERFQFDFICHEGSSVPQKKEIESSVEEFSLFLPIPMYSVTKKLWRNSSDKIIIPSFTEN